MIPKRIIQTWGGSLDLPLLAKAAAANVRLLNPQFEYLLFDDHRMDDFVRDEFPEYRSVFGAFSIPVQRYDFFRYLAVYRLGGFYFDFDVLLANSVEGLSQFACVFPFEKLTLNAFLRKTYAMDWELGNYAFGAVPNHPFLEAIIGNCIRAQKDSEWVEPMMRPIPRVFRDEFRVLYTTGPGLVSRTFAEYVKDKTDITVLFPGDVCDVSYWDRFGEVRHSSKARELA